ncbi:hypothetical protein KIW84_055609 [Lathyrus oleraceus]|uniref:Uncharacterized protein n=1 Tax=Pisum sativum TaxID=3888 RepID=A0A9D4X0Y3_PEA|nr:hypothetical protein KIW84_055609 [Pisum sativum]
MPRSTSSGFSKRVVCQFCDKSGHTAKACYKLHGYPPKNQPPTALHTRVMPSGASNWILDSGASHYIINELDNLHLSQPYTGLDQLLDLKTREPLQKGQHRNGLYDMPHPSSLPQALVTSTYIPPPWHHILGHPFDRILRHILPYHKIKSQQQPCLSCDSVKSHKLPFSISSIKTQKPLELVYTDV